MNPIHQKIYDAAALRIKYPTVYEAQRGCPDVERQRTTQHKNLTFMRLGVVEYFSTEESAKNHAGKHGQYAAIDSRDCIDSIMFQIQN